MMWWVRRRKRQRGIEELISGLRRACELVLRAVGEVVAFYVRLSEEEQARFAGRLAELKAMMRGLEPFEEGPSEDPLAGVEEHVAHLMNVLREVDRWVDLFDELLSEGGPSTEALAGVEGRFWALQADVAWLLRELGRLDKGG